MEKVIVTAKTAAAKEELDKDPMFENDEVFSEEITDYEFYYLYMEMAAVFDEFAVIIDEYEYDEIENGHVGALLEIVDKNKAPVLYRALMYAEESDDRVQLCF